MNISNGIDLMVMIFILTNITSEMYVFAVKCITYIYLLTTYIGVVLREKVHSHSLEKVGRFRKAKKMKLHVHAQTCAGSS